MLKNLPYDTLRDFTPVSLMVSRAFPDKAGLANGVASAGMSAGQLVIIAFVINNLG